ncbi:MAG TPA: hypothetical protein VIF15_17025 [Polyangiaceae bacterium]|jgi:hypothetical protein
MRRRAAALLAVLGCAAGAACSSSPAAPPQPVVACDSTVSVAPTDTFALADVEVTLEGTDPLLAPVRVDLASYLGAMWGGPVAVAATPPDVARRATLWLSSSPAAAAALGTTIGDGYAIKRIDTGGKTTLLVYAGTAADLVSGAYALLEELGARFFHPKQELVPALGAPRLPQAIDVWRRPMAKRRGLQPHTLHPIEYLATFMEPGADNLADAKRFVDWLVKTGQNLVQWPLLATVDWASWKPHAQAILDYAHSRGVRVGAVPQVWGGAALQNNVVLVTDASKWRAQMSAALDHLMELPWDFVELALGEFTGADPQQIIDWLSYATDYLVTKDPAIEVDVQNHVGNYPQLWVQYQGQRTFYYHLPQYSDARLGQSVHTLSLFDVYREWATYAHPDFHLQHDYLLKELPTRRVSYFPESAYWISADIDVPAFLPEHLHARWLDIHGLSAEIADRGLPPLGGHVTFTSGHEWGYWLTDYLVAKMLWEPGAPLDHFLAHYAAAYGSCENDVTAALSSYVKLQTSYLFDHRLLSYVQGENSTVDEGYLAGLETHPRRLAFEQVAAMGADERAGFEATIVQALESFAAESQPIEDAVAARCRGADAALAPWCDELWDGIAIVRLRAQHAALLYRAVLAYAGGGDGMPLVDRAARVTDQAAQVVARREAQYRFDLDRVAGNPKNPTIYGFGYLRPAHTQCYWRRREEQVAFLLQNGVAEGILSLPNCQD